jgi:microcystin-dependent protein
MDPLISSIMGWGPSWAPRAWALCHGQLLPISSYTAVFSLIGTTYGGDGRTTFALPDLRGRVPIAAGQSPGTSFYPLGARMGSETETLTQLQMPQHNHSANVSSLTVAPAANSGDAGVIDPNGNYPAIVKSGPTSLSAYATTANATMGPAAVSGTVTIGNAGGSQPISILQPLQAIQFIFCLEGIFPSRN